MSKMRFCKKCDAQILPHTYNKTGGYCAPCSQFNVEDELDRVRAKRQLALKRRQRRNVDYRDDPIFENNMLHRRVSIVAFAGMLVAIVNSFTATNLQEQILLALRGILLVTSLYMMFHGCFYMVKDKAYFRGVVIYKNEDKAYFYLIVGFYMSAATLVLAVALLLWSPAPVQEYLSINH